MRTITIELLAMAVLLGPPLQAQERKPVPKDSVRVFVAGCARGAVFTAGRRVEDQPGAVVPEGMRLRMLGPKKTMSEIRAHEGARIEITGLIRQGQMVESGVGLGGGVRAGPGPAVGGGTGMPAPSARQAVIDVEGWRLVAGDCPVR
jgi:hypothetical protein